MKSTYKYKKTSKHGKKRFARKTSKFRSKKRGGGTTFAQNYPVSLSFMNQSVKCEVCGQNNFTETVGTLGKSKVRQGIMSIFFGESSGVLDNTSIITYFCNICGLSKMIRNNDEIRILTSPAAQGAPAAEAPAAQAAPV